MTVGPDGMLYVIDPAGVVTVIDPATAGVVRRFGRHGAADGEFACICSIDAAPDGRLYVIDGGNRRIQILEADGTYLRQLGSFGEADGQFVAPFGLTVDAEGAVYVLDGATSLISKFDPDGAFVWRVGGPKGDDRLRETLHGLAAMKDGTILVTLDPGGRAVLLDPEDGSVIGPWGDESLGWSAEPEVDPAGNVLLFQYGPAGAMRVFDPSGRPLGIRNVDPDPSPQRFFPAPVVAPDGYGYSFGDTQGLVRLEITLR
jgi:DNA-binding beta-propeller fold protein YncE